MKKLYRIHRISTCILYIDMILVLICLIFFKSVVPIVLSSMAFIMIISGITSLISRYLLEKAIEKDKAKKNADRAGKFNIF